MARLSFCLLLLFCLHYMSSVKAKAGIATHPRASNFIKSSCKATRYPDLCVVSLSSYSTRVQQSQRQLAQAALSVSIARARSTSVFVSRLTQVSGLKPREHQAVIDCIDNMGDSVDQLTRSVHELGRMGQLVGGQDFMWHMSNVQTWVSSALTDENTCLDGFSGSVMNGNVKAGIRNRVIYVAQVTSNALALVNRFATRHRTGVTTNEP